MDEVTYNGEEHKLKFKIVFKGNEGTVLENDKITNEYAKIKVKIDPSTKPKIMDITVSAGSQTDATMEAIYELKGDELRFPQGVRQRSPRRVRRPGRLQQRVIDAQTCPVSRCGEEVLSIHVGHDSNRVFSPCGHAIGMVFHGL